jgi:hypothetical protein
MRSFKRWQDNALGETFLQEVSTSGKLIGKPIGDKSKAKTFNTVNGYINNSNNPNYQLVAEKTSNNTEMRKAGERVNISPEDMSELTKKWVKYDRDRSLPNYYGRNESDWKQDNRNIRDELLQIDRDGGDYDDLYDKLLDKGFRQDKEIDNIIKNLHRKRVLHTQSIGLPGNVADEALSKAVLDYSGFSPVRLENDGDPTATDLVARIGGADRYIDAQSRIMSTPMNVELTKFNNQAYDIIDSNPGLSLLDLAKKLKNRIPSITESKFFETKDLNFNPIQGYKVRNNPNASKDYLISSDRRGMGVTNNPYNKILPRDWDMIDLNRARDLLLPLTRQQMYDKYEVEINQGRRSNNPLIYLPDKFVKQYLIDTDNPLNLDAVRQLTQ